MRVYDFGLNWSGTVKEHFVGSLKNFCRKKNFSFLWISNDNVRKIIKRLQKKEIGIKALLDTEATYNKEGDLYTRVCYAVKDSGGVVISDPDRTKIATDKSITHYELEEAGISTPYSVMVRSWEPNFFKLADDEKKKLGVPFVIKPAYGYGQLGVVRDARGSVREIAQARQYDRGDTFLFQEKVDPLELRGRRAWFRVFHVFDTIIPCWWDDRVSLYSHVTAAEFKKYRLLPLVNIVARIAEITRMAWFSTEIAIDKKNRKRRFVAIDYVNDQCDMTAQSESKGGVPDNIVDYTASTIVNAAYKLIQGKKIYKSHSVRLKDATIIPTIGLKAIPEYVRKNLYESPPFKKSHYFIPVKHSGAI